MTEAKSEYYSQWQLMPGDAADWQNNVSERNHPGRRIAVDMIASMNCTSVLEVACGIGVDYPKFQEKSIAYFGVDITPKFVAEAQRNGVPCKVASALQLPFGDGEFDAVYCKDLLLHLAPGDWKVALKEMVRVARKVVVVLDHEWQDATKYYLAEHYQSSDKRELFFFNNVYNRSHVEAYAEELGCDVSYCETGSASYGVKVVQPNLVTVFTRRK